MSLCFQICFTQLDVTWKANNLRFQAPHPQEGHPWLRIQSSSVQDEEKLLASEDLEQTQVFGDMRVVNDSWVGTAMFLDINLFYGGVDGYFLGVF